MTDREYAKQKARIQRLSKKWLEPLGLLWWDIKLVFHRNPFEEREDGRICYAKAVVNWEYLSASLSFDLRALEEESDEELERVFVHECCHVLVHELRMWAPSELEKDAMDEGMHHEERVVSMLTNAFLWTRKDGAKKPKRKKKR